MSEDAERVPNDGRPPAFTWDRKIARWFSYLILFFMFDALLQGLTCGMRGSRSRDMVQFESPFTITLPVECGNSRVFFGWPIVAFLAIVVARLIEIRCDASGHRWLTAGGRFRWIALWLVSFCCGRLLLNLL